MWVRHLNEYLIKKKNHVNNQVGVVYKYNINGIHTIHSWPFYGVEVVVLLASLVFTVKKTQHLGQSVSLQKKMYSLNDYININFVNSGGLLLFSTISVSALLSLFIIVGVVGET